MAIICKGIEWFRCRCGLFRGPEKNIFGITSKAPYKTTCFSQELFQAQPPSPQVAATSATLQRPWRPWVAPVSEWQMWRHAGGAPLQPLASWADERARRAAQWIRRLGAGRPARGRGIPPPTSRRLQPPAGQISHPAAGGGLGRQTRPSRHFPCWGWLTCFDVRRSAKRPSPTR